MQAIMERVSTPEQIHTVVALAREIWTEHYTPIIGAEQVGYMLANIHSLTTITEEVTDPHCHYYLVQKADQPVGYIGVRFRENALFLSKLYVLSSERGNGLGKQAIEFLKQLARSNQCRDINLTVNRHNTGTIAAYKAIGFEMTEAICADIGNGYVMDDYRMVLQL